MGPGYEPKQEASASRHVPAKGRHSASAAKTNAGNLLHLQQTGGNRATQQTLKFSDADGDLVLAVAATLENVQHGRLEYPKSHGEHFPHSGFDVLQSIIYAATDVEHGNGREQARKLAHVRATLQPILQRLIHADPLAGPQYVKESIEEPLAKLEGHVQGRGVALRAGNEADREGAGEWLKPWEVKELQTLCAQTKACVSEMHDVLQRESQKHGNKPDPGVLGDRTAAKIVQADVTATNRSKAAELGKGYADLAKADPSGRVVGLAVLSHAKAVLDIVDQALLLSDGPQRKKLWADISALADNSKSSADRISGALLGVQTALLAVEAAFSISAAVFTAVAAGKAIAGNISFADFIKEASTSVVKTGYAVSGARITGMLNVITAIRGAIKAADPNISLEERGVAIRDTLSGAVGGIRFHQAAYKLLSEGARKRLPQFLGKEVLTAETAGIATSAIWLAWLEFEAGRFVLENAPKAVGRLIDYDIARAFDVIGTEGSELQRQLKIVLSLSEAASKSSGDNSTRAQGFREVLDDALAELRKRTAHAYNACNHDGGTNTPGHYAPIRKALRAVDQNIIQRGLGAHALPEETILAAMSVLSAIRQAWSTYESVRREGRKDQFADKPVP